MYVDASHCFLHITDAIPVYSQHEDEIQLPRLRLSNILWDPTTEEGVVSDFDLINPACRSSEDGLVSMTAELMNCKELCGNRTICTTRDRLEPCIWLLVSVCLESSILSTNPLHRVGPGSSLKTGDGPLEDNNLTSETLHIYNATSEYLTFLLVPGTGVFDSLL